MVHGMVVCNITESDSGVWSTGWRPCVALQSVVPLHPPNIWYAAGDEGHVTVQKLTVIRTQLGKCGMDWPRQQTFKWWESLTFSSSWSGFKSHWNHWCRCF